MQLYKYSQFNIIADQTEDKVLIYNTYTLNYRWIDNSELDDIQDKQSIDIGDVPVYLANEGFIVPNTLDEIQRLKDDAKAHAEKADFMFLSIFTTLACNYRCVYCFEKDQLCQTEHMTKETADEIIAFIKRRYVDHKFTKPLKIKWFGGEPLLNMDIIRYISNALIINNIEFNARMYTNGRLLTKEIAEELKSLHVTDEVVIPLDGLAPTYAKLKNCTEDDFYKTIQNIKDVEDILKITIHINISEASKSDILQLVKLIRNDYKIKSSFNTISIAPQNTTIINSENNISYDEFHKIKDILLKDAVIPLRRRYGCEARHPDYYVIDTKGDIYICEHLVGQKKYIVGNIKDQSSIINRNGTLWDNSRIIDDCKECPILPLCFGYCTSQRFIDNIDCQKDKRIEATKQQLLKLISNRNQSIKHQNE